MLSFDDSTTSVDEVNSEMEPAEVTAFIRKFRLHFSTLKVKWACVFTEVEAGYGLVVQDLQKLQSLTKGHSEMVGASVTLDGEKPSSLWDGLQSIHESVFTVASAVQAHATSLDALAADQTNLAHLVLALEMQADSTSSLSNAVSRITVDLRALENRVLRLVPLLQQIRSGNPTVGSFAASPDHLMLASKVEACEQTLLQLRQIITELQDRPHDNALNASAMDSRLCKVQAQMKQLQFKVIEKGV
jgi:hypothetical protein